MWTQFCVCNETQLNKLNKDTDGEEGGIFACTKDDVRACTNKISQYKTILYLPSSLNNLYIIETTK
jgi:hypothetical protein